MDTLEFMTDATIIPIVLDDDTGYDNFNNMNNMRRLVRKLEQRGVAGGVHRGQALPQDQQLHRRRAPAPR